MGTPIAGMPGLELVAAPGAHWLHPQVSSRMPRRWVFLDTEAWRDDIPGGEEQRWRLGVTACISWRSASATWSPIVPVRHATPDSLWQAVTSFARKDARTVVVAHNLGYDLRISDAFRWLLAHGWTIERPTFGGDSVTCEVKKYDRRLILTDNRSYLPGSLGRIGELLGMPKPALPDDDESEATWWERCESDVTILATAHLTLMDWLSRHDLGSWARTGASLGWHTLLRRHMAEPVLVHGDDDVREHEVAAMYGGRCEVWRWGRLKGGPWYEWDYELAYGHVAASTSLPTVLQGEVRGLSMAAIGLQGPGTRTLVEAEIATTVPVLPWHDGQGVLWPTGTFRGWWWDVELAAAVAAGAKVRVVHAYRYRAAPWLASWATWAIDLVGDDSTPQARIIGAAAKHWTRSVVGRTAMRYKDWQRWGDAYQPGVAYAEQLDIATGKRGHMLTLGSDRWEAWEQRWSDGAIPQALSAVTAECRVRLWAAMTAVGLENVVYCDTDCLIVGKAGHEALQAAVKAGLLPGLRLKAVHRSLELTAPQMVAGAGYRRMAGIPTKTWVDEQGQRWGEVWEGITSSLADGRPDRVRVLIRAINIQGVDTRRRHLPGGATEPFSVSSNEHVKNVEVAS